MKLEMLASSPLEVGMMIFLIVLGSGFLVFAKKVELIMAGVVTLTGVMVIAYTNHSHFIEERFLMKEFNSGSTLSCGVWRGAEIKVDPNNGWIMEEGVGFVKEDMIVKDPGVCRVIDQPSPEPYALPYWIVLGSVMGILIMIRIALMRHESKDEHTEEKNDAGTRTE